MRRVCARLAHARALGSAATADAAAAVASAPGAGLYGVVGLREPRDFARLAQDAVRRRDAATRAARVPSSVA